MSKNTSMFVVTMNDPDKTQMRVEGKGRQSACMRTTGHRVAQAIAKGLIVSIEPATTTGGHASRAALRDSRAKGAAA